MKAKIAERLALSERDARLIAELLQTHVPNRPVWAFGSRTFDRARRYSDLDLAIGGTEALSTSVEYDLEESFDRSVLPIEVDLTDLNAVSDRFRASIEPYFVPVQEPSGDAS